MQIQSLKVNGFKLLENFEIEFDTVAQGDSITVLIGENGAGKSTMLEVILRIFGGFYSNKIANEYNFDYTIKYLYASKLITINRTGKQYNITEIEDGDDLEGINIFQAYKGTLSTLHRNKIKEKGIFPARLISFYSGNNDRLLPITKTLERAFAKTWNNNVSDYFDITFPKTGEEKHLSEVDSYDVYQRKFIHCDDKQLPIYFISLLCHPSQEKREKTALELGVDMNFKVHIELNLLKWKSNLEDRDMYSLSRFNSMIDFILDEDDGKGQFINLLYSTNNKLIKDDKLFWSLDNTFFIGLSQINIYNMLERLTAVFDAKIRISCDGMDIIDFSEGQRQFIKILGMLSICKNEECLVIMDEPDAHMNPKWKYNIRDFMENAVEGAINTQVLIATHDPLVINGMESENISIFQKSESGIKVQRSENDTFGMGIDGLLQSEYYGLKTSYDKETSDKYQKRQELYIKLVNNDIANEEKENLRALTKEIGSLPVANNTIDFLYDDFMSVFRNTDFYKQEYLNFEQLEERRQKIKEIIATLYEEMP